MKPENELALIVGYYLSRMDKDGYIALGYKNFNEATENIGEILGVKKNTIKNMRDEFDPYHQNSRVGWLRELRGSRLRVLRAFQETDDDALFEIVKEILNNPEFKKTEEYIDIHALFGDRKTTIQSDVEQIFIPRGPTGKAAEAFFLEYFERTEDPHPGKIIDCRELGCGYDFEIKGENEIYYIEVKGLATTAGGILLTNKELGTALKHKERYFIALVRNLSEKPAVTIIENPISKLRFKKSIQTTIQVSWGCYR